MCCKRLVFVLFITLLGLLMWGCSAIPEKEVAAVKASLRAAECADAAIYAPRSWANANDAFQAAEKEIDNQNKKGRVFRSFSHAKDMLGEAQDMAENAVQEAETVREEAKRSACAARNNVHKKLAGVEAMMTQLAGCSKQSNAFKEEFVELRAKLDEIEATSETIADDIKSEGYIAATVAGNETVKDLDEFLESLSDAKEASGC